MTGDLRRYAGANARVRGLLVSLLGRAGLEALYSYPTRAAIIDVLRRTGYGAAMRGELQSDADVRRRLIAVGEAVLGMLAGAEALFVKQYLLRHEVENLKLIIRAVYRGVAWEQIAAHILPLKAIGTIEPEDLASAPDLHELVTRLAGTPYHAVLTAALRRLDDVGPFALEVAVELDYYDRLWSATEALRATDTVWGQRLLGILFDILNLGYIARYRDVLALAPEEIPNYTLRQGRWLTPELRRALAARSDGGWDTVLAGTPYAPLFAGPAVAHGFEAACPGLWRVLAGEVQRALRVYPFHIGVPLGFLLAQEIEIRDLQILLAAKSLGCAAGEALECVATVRH